MIYTEQILLKFINDLEINKAEEAELDGKAYSYVIDKKYRWHINEKYDYRHSQLIFVFAQLVGDGYMSIEELESIGEEKQKQIKDMVNFRGFESWKHLQ